jgi:hypothetical protein
MLYDVHKIFMELEANADQYEAIAREREDAKPSTAAKVLSLGLLAVAAYGFYRFMQHQQREENHDRV